MNKTTFISLLATGLLCSCAVQSVCPAYQSAFILDPTERQDLFSLFTVVEGDTVPKRPVGFRFQSEGDSLMDKFIAGTPGRGFRVQNGRIHSFEKAGFTYENRKKERLWVKLFSGKEKPVLENPYLFDRITKKRPFYKLDHLSTDLVNFNSVAYQSFVRSVINNRDSTRYDSLMAEMAALPTAIQIQYAPLLRGGFNVEQEAYDRRFQEYFVKLEEVIQEDITDTLGLMAFQYDTLSTDTVAKKKGFFGLFKRKNKRSKPEREKKQKPQDENKEGVLEDKLN